MPTLERVYNMTMKDDEISECEHCHRNHNKDEGCCLRIAQSILHEFRTSQPAYTFPGLSEIDRTILRKQEVVHIDIESIIEEFLIEESLYCIKGGVQ